MNKLKLVLAAALTVGSLGLATPAFAACTDASNCISDGINATGQGGTKAKSLGDIIKTVVNTLLFILGAVAVIMIVIGGIRYTISQGDSGAVTSAKNTILYAVIGLIVAIMAYAIVNFVVTAFK